ncbi:NTP transferase domain-containing protein [Candidatus Sumerlaeota bacterium]|nr:NTP transferase domain-containing protein [Candidatus Sumerlaeota bacterium]
MISIILAAGKATRMGATTQPKVCLDVGGLPFVVRAIETYKRCGIEHHIVVIGDRADEVAAAVCRYFPSTIFAYQAEQRGTGHAARCGAAVLEAFGYSGDVMIVVGDKLVTEAVVREQIELFHSSGADLCFMVGPKDSFPHSGRVVEDEDGAVLGVVEVSEIKRACLIEKLLDEGRKGALSADRIRSETIAAFSTERKASRAVPILWTLLEQRSDIGPDDLTRCFTRKETILEFERADGKRRQFRVSGLEQQTSVANLSVYMFRTDALFYGLGRLASLNAQGEEYLTDVVGILASARTDDGSPRFRVVPYNLKEPTDGLTFNTPEELEAIRECLKRKAEG